jgi:membrane protein involved in colicin uptake
MAAPKQSGHMNKTEHGADGAMSSVASQADSLSSQTANPAQLSARSVLPLVDSVAYDACPSRASQWNRALSRAVPASLVLLGALALGTASSVLGPVDNAVSWTELARVARMQLVAADAVYAPQALTGAASELSPDGSDQGGSRSERMRARKEAAEARRAAAKERREAAKQARLEARQARKDARLARKSSREEEDDEEESSSGSDSREARRQAYAERRAAAKEKREAAAAARREAAEERRSAYAERKAAAKEKRESAAGSRYSALQERREAAKARREEKLAARREAAEARRAAKEERLAARENREERSSRSEASPTVSSNGSFGRTETAMAPASGAALLRINSRPWAQVYVDGRLVGNTPQLALQLPPGEHNVRLVNGVFAMGKVINVKLRAGERVTRVEMLEE